MSYWNKDERMKQWWYRLNTRLINGTLQFACFYFTTICTTFLSLDASLLYTQFSSDLAMREKTIGRWNNERGGIECQKPN